MGPNRKFARWIAHIQLKKKGSQPSDNGTIRLIRTLDKKGKPGFRANFTYMNHYTHRFMGSVKRTVFEATSQLLESRVDLWALGEQERVSKAAMLYKTGKKMDEDPSPQREKAWGSQPKRDGTKPNSLPCECIMGMVAYVHQMYGFFGDGNPKPEVFQ